MNNTKYQPQTINEVVFGNDESPLKAKRAFCCTAHSALAKQRWLAYCPKLLKEDKLDNPCHLTLTFLAANKGTRALSLPTH
jgi:hypothetical protein